MDDAEPASPGASHTHKPTDSMVTVSLSDIQSNSEHTQLDWRSLDIPRPLLKKMRPSSPRPTVPRTRSLVPPYSQTPCTPHHPSKKKKNKTSPIRIRTWMIWIGSIWTEPRNKNLGEKDQTMCVIHPPNFRQNLGSMANRPF